MIRIHLDFSDYRAPDPHGVMVVAYSTECSTHSVNAKKPSSEKHMVLWCHLPSIHARYRISPHVFYDPLPAGIVESWRIMAVMHKDAIQSPTTLGTLQLAQRPCSVIISVYQNVDWTFDGDRRIVQWKQNHPENRDNLPIALLSQLHIDNIIISPERLYEAHTKGKVSWLSTIVDVRRMTQDLQSREASCIYGSVLVTLEHITQSTVPTLALRAPIVRKGLSIPDALAAKRDYTEEYLKAFPHPFQKFATVPPQFKSSFDFDSISGNHGIWYPRANHSVNIHMPTFDVYAHSARQALAVPVFYYYAHRQDAPWIVHETFFMTLLRASAASHGYNIDQEDGRMGLMNLFQRALVEDDPCAGATAMEVINLLLTAYATHGKYRTDYRMRLDGERVELESIDMDASLIDSDDCEGKSNITHQVIFLLMHGRPDVDVNQSPYIRADRLWTDIILPRAHSVPEFYGTSLRRGVLGTWEAPLLQQIQCILGHYMPCSVLGSVLAAFLDAEHERIPRVDPDRLDADAKISESFRIDAPADLQCSSGGHQWDILLPIRDFMQRMVQSLTTEMSRSSGRFTKDQLEVDEVLKLANEVLAIPEIPLERLGGLVIESTGRATPWLLSRSQALDPGVRVARRIAHDLKQAKALRGGVFSVKNGHAMRRTSTEGEWRRGSWFYRDVAHMVCVRLHDLCGVRDICNLSPVQGHRWQVPLERILTPGGTWRALPILHRMDRGVRDRLHDVMSPYYALFPPISIGSWLSEEQLKYTVTRDVSQYAARIFMSPETAKKFESIQAPTLNPLSKDRTVPWNVACRMTTVSSPVGCVLPTDWEALYQYFARGWSFFGCILQRIQGTTGQVSIHFIFCTEDTSHLASM